MSREFGTAPHTLWESYNEEAMTARERFDFDQAATRSLNIVNEGQALLQKAMMDKKGRGGDRSVEARQPNAEDLKEIEDEYERAKYGI